MNLRNHLSAYYLFLTEKDKAVLKNTSKAQLYALQGLEPVPYRKQFDFMLSISGNFPTASDTYAASWMYYQTICLSTNKQSAIIYKGCDPRLQQKMNALTVRDGISILDADSGRCYSPNRRHYWKYNFAWLKANIDLGRPIEVISSLDEKYLMDGKKPSAFAKEIAIVVKAGYRLNYINEDSTHFSPPRERSTAHLALSMTDTIGFFNEARRRRQALLDSLQVAMKQLEIIMQEEKCFIDELIASPESCKKQIKEDYTQALPSMLLLLMDKLTALFSEGRVQGSFIIKILQKQPLLSNIEKKLESLLLVKCTNTEKNEKALDYIIEEMTKMLDTYVENQFEKHNTTEAQRLFSSAQVHPLIAASTSSSVITCLEDSTLSPQVK